MAATRHNIIVAIVVAAVGGAAVGSGVAVVVHYTAGASARMAMLDGNSASKPKQLWTCGMHPQVIQDHPGNCPICHMKLTPLHEGDADGNGAGKPKKVAYWWDPMLGPSSIADRPGKSAMGMDRVPVYEDQAGPSVRIDPAVVQNMGVLTAPVERGPLAVTVRAVGMLQVPEPAMTDVTLRVGGYIEKLYADTAGMTVARGQVLFDLYSPDVQVAEQELIGAVQAARSLDAASPGVKADSRGMVESARRKLQLWGIADGDIDAIAAGDRPPATVPFRSPAGGHVEDKAVVAGSAVQAGQKLMRIEDHSKLWLDVQVYEDQIGSVALGQTVRATVDGLPGQVFTGPVSFIYPHMDHMTRTETVRAELDNPGHALRPGMYATAEVVTRPVADAILVPREAVIDTGTRQIAFVVDPAVPGRFQPRRVRMGIAGDDDRVQVVEGLAPGEQVVTSGQFLMDVESRTAEAIEKLRGTAGTGAAMVAGPVPADAAGMGSMPMASPTPPAMGAMPMTPPATAPASVLSVAHCPMKKADWLQVGDAIVNPYFGTAMPTCGSVVRTVASPPAGSPPANVVDAYLKVAAGMDADRLDAAAVGSLQKAAAVVPALRVPTERLARATDVDGARAAFAAEGAALIPLLSADH